MTRHFFSLILLLLASGAIGCRMCGSQYDYCMPAYTQRAEDYRGCDPIYRAGSVLHSEGSCLDGSEVAYGSDLSVNAGNFGETTYIQEEKRKSRLTPSRGPSAGLADLNGEGGEGLGIGRPLTAPNLDENGPNLEIPQDLLPMPEEPFPNRSPVPPAPTLPPKSVEPTPFMSTSNGPPSITAEDLKRLDPSVVDVKILNIEDSVDSAFQKGATRR